MGLGGVVHHGVGARHEAVHQARVADVAHDELDPILGQPRDVLRVAGVGQLVQDGDVHAGALAHHVVHEVAPDEAAAASDDYAAGLEGCVGHDYSFRWIKQLLLQKVAMYSASSSVQSRGSKPAARTLERSRSEWVGRGAMGPSAEA